MLPRTFQKLNMGGGEDFDADAADINEGNFDVRGVLKIWNISVLFSSFYAC